MSINFDSPDKENSYFCFEDIQEILILMKFFWTRSYLGSIYICIEWLKIDLFMPTNLNSRDKEFQTNQPVSEQGLSGI